MKSNALSMSEDQLKAFLKAVKNDTNLQQKIKAATDQNAITAIAKEAGFVISAEEVEKSQTSSEISEEELEFVAGGAFFTLWNCPVLSDPGLSCGC